MFQGRLLHRLITGADLGRIEQIVPEELKELAKRTAAQIEARRRKISTRRKRHVSTQ